MNEKGFLSPYRVLDISNETGAMCGKILGDLGADVIKIERPGGDASRNIGPFYHDIPEPEKSLFWFAFNSSKRGITLNIESADGKEIFKKLVKTADVIVESFPPGRMDCLGLGYSVLSQINSNLIMTSITPFGQTGPWKNYKISDIVALATSGGVLFETGDPDRPPVSLPGYQSFFHAGTHAAVGTLLALLARNVIGKGQQVDVSIRDSVTRCFLQEPGFWDFVKHIFTRKGTTSDRYGVIQRFLYLCKDGYVAMHLLTGTYFKGRVGLLKWMAEEGELGTAIELYEDGYNIDIRSITQERWDKWEEAVSTFFLKHTKQEIYERAVKSNIHMAPVHNTQDVGEDKQLVARGFWQQVNHPALGFELTYPSGPARISQIPWEIKRCAPAIGEHNKEIYEDDLGLSREQMVILKEGNII